MFKLIKKVFVYGFVGMFALAFLGALLESDEDRANRFAQQEAEAQAELLAEQEADRIHAENMQDPKYAFQFIADKLDSKACSYTRNYIRDNVKSRKSLDFDGYCRDWAVFYTDGTPDSAGYIKIIQKFSATNSFNAVIDSAVEGIFIVNTVDNTLSVKSITVL